MNQTQANQAISASAPSHWDSLPDDVQENIIVRCTHLHYDDCLTELDTRGPNDKKANIIRQIIAKFDAWFLNSETTELFEAYMRHEIGECTNYGLDLFLEDLIDGWSLHDLYHAVYTYEGLHLCGHCLQGGTCSKSGLPYGSRPCEYPNAYENRMRRNYYTSDLKHVLKVVERYHVGVELSVFYDSD